jgi:hypothetical protein
MNSPSIPEMSLDEFVKRTIVEIVKGVADASKDLKDHGAVTNPPPTGEDSDLAQAGVVRVRGGGAITFIDFDVEVSASSGQDRSSGISVIFAGIGAGFKEENRGGSTVSNRVRFRVPVKLP